MVRQGKVEPRAQDYAAQALRMAQQIGDENTISNVLETLGMIAQASGKLDEAEAAYAGQIATRPLWLRSLLVEPDRHDWVYWQYHNRGRVDGIEGDVDLNVLQGGPAVLAALSTASPGSILPEAPPSP